MYIFKIKGSTIPLKNEWTYIVYHLFFFNIFEKYVLLRQCILYLEISVVQIILLLVCVYDFCSSFYFESICFLNATPNSSQALSYE